MPSSKGVTAVIGLRKPRQVKSQMTEDEISNEMTILDIQLKDLEKKGVKLEEMLRDEMELEVESKPDSDHLLGDWIDLVQEKNKLVRRETDLVYLMQQQRLEQEHADVEFMIRKLMNKPESEKTKEDQEREAQLVEKLVKIVERRNTIINSIEEARVKEELEDAALDELKEQKTDSSTAEGSNKKKKKKKEQDTAYDKVDTMTYDSHGAEGSTKKKKGMKRIFHKKKGHKSPKQEEETPSST